MKIAIDMDGVLYEFQRTLVYMFTMYRGCQFPPGLDWWDKWNSFYDYTTKEDRTWMWTEGVRLGLFRYGHMVKNARVGLEALHQDGHKFIVVTSRPENASEDTLAWLNLYFKNIPLSGLLIQQGTKRLTKADLLIDDKPEHCLEWGAGRNAILFDQPWNQSLVLQGWEKVRRANGWFDVVKIVRGET